MKVVVLGPGCPSCQNLEIEVINALAELNVAADVEKVEQMEKIKEYDLEAPPALVINGKVKVYGRVPRREEMKQWIREEQ